jgi:hypothetical protein
VCLDRYNPFGGFIKTGDFLYDALEDSDSGLLLFTWFMSGMVGVITRNGGADGLGASFGRAATSQRRAQVWFNQVSLFMFFLDVCTIVVLLIICPLRQVLALIAGILLFWDDYSSILILG